MLRIHTATSSAAVKKYFEAADYYTQGDEVAGRWGGKLAERLGLSGDVTKEAFERLCDNLHPLTGKPLTPRTRAERRVGDDFVLSLPKEVGAAIMLAPKAEREALLKLASDRAHQVMEAIQADVQTRVRKAGAESDRDTGNMVWAEFMHTTARPVNGQPPDPHPHWHMFNFNATHDPIEDRIKAIQLGNVYRDRSYYESLFFSLVAGDLAERGYAVERRDGGKWGLKGLESVGESFSKRTDEIEAEAKRLDVTSAAEKSGLGAKTRAAKQKEMTPEQLRAAWIGQLGDGERDALLKTFRKQVVPSRQATAHEAVAYAVAHLSEQRSIFAEREVIREALAFGIGSVTPAQIEAEMQEPAHGLFVGELPGLGDGRRYVSTDALEAEERYIVRQASWAGGSAIPIGVSPRLERGKLNDGQWAAVQGLLESSNRVNLVEGPAGAGKSSMLATFDRGARLAGEKVAYLATTSPAAKVLAKDGFDAATVAYFLRSEKAQAAAAGGRLVVDEASMLGHKDTVKLFKIAEKQNIKIIFVGDAMQHGSVPRGSLLHVLKDFAGVKPLRLTQIMRQEDADYRHAAELLSQGRTLDGFDALDRKEWVREIGDDADRYRAMAADYLQATAKGESCLVISPTHGEAAAITVEIRTQLREAGRLGEKETTFTHLVNTNASEAERGQAWAYRPGDVLIFHQNAKGHQKGSRLVVDDPATVPLEHAGKFSIYRPKPINLAAGDKIRFVGSVKAMRGDKAYKNGDTHTVAEITPGGNLRLDDGKVISKDAGLYRSAFVETSFGSQGQTVKRAILGIAAESLPATNQEQIYVSASRAKQSVHIYTDDKQAVRSAIQATSQKHAALDLVAAAPEPAAPKPDWRKDDAEHRRRLRWETRRLDSIRLALLNETRPIVVPHLAELQLSQGSSRGR